MSDAETELSTLRQKVAEAAKTCTDLSLLDLIYQLLLMSSKKQDDNA